MIKRKSVLSRFGILGLSCGASWLLAACGEKDANEPVDIGPVRENCETNPYLAECPPITPAEPPPVIDGEPPPGVPGPPSPGDLVTAQVENILKINCGSCHGSQLALEDSEGRMNYINDIDALVDNDKIIPLNSRDSFIIQRMRDKTMPPAGSGFTVTDTDIDFVANFIDDPDIWDVEPPVCDETPVITFDNLYEDVARDLARQEADEREFFRYISLTNRVTAGVCSNTALDRDRHALIKMVNMLSIDSGITEPEFVDEEKTLYRIDLREYEWNREIVVDGEAFADVWEAIIDGNDYAVPFVGDDADSAREDALTDVPVMFLDSMLDTAIIGNLYYAIIDVDVNQPLDTFISDVLEIDVAANIDQEEVVRAGTTRTRVSKQDRLVEGHEIGVRPGAFYQSFDFAADAANDSIFEDPFGFNEGGREAIFTLPNGLLAYLIADADGNLVEESNILLDTRQDNYLALTATSCSSCHFGGFISVVDEVRDSVIANARVLIANGTLDEEQLDQVKAIYKPAKEFESRVKADSSFYLRALEQANLPTTGSDPVSSVFTRFDDDMDLADAAGDLGLSADELNDDIDLLDTELGILRIPRGGTKGGTLDRDDFTALYVVSLCALSGTLKNQPDAAACAAAELELDQ